MISPYLLLIIGCFFSLAFLLILFLNPRVGLLSFLFFRPIIDSLDMLRTYDIPFIHINSLQFIGLVVPYLLLIIVLLYKPNIYQYKFLNIYMIFILSCIPSIILSDDRVFDVASIIKLFTFCSIVLFTSTFITSVRDIKQTLFVVLVSSFYPLIKFGIDYLKGNIVVIGGIERNLGGYFHMSVISTMLLLFIPAYLFFLLTTNRKVIKTLMIISIGLIIQCIYLTQYRTTLIGVVVLFMTFLFLQRRYAGTFLICLSVILLAVAVPSLRERFAPLGSVVQSLPALFDPDNSRYDDLLSGRFAIWRSIITSIIYKSHLGNILFGFGHLPRLASGDISPHSDFLGIWFQYGILAVILFCFYAARALVEISKKMDSTLSQIIYATMFAMLAVSLAHVTLEDTRNLLYLGVYIVLAVKYSEYSAMDRGENYVRKAVIAA